MEESWCLGARGLAVLAGVAASGHWNPRVEGGPLGGVSERHFGGDSASRVEDWGAEETGAGRDQLQPETCAREEGRGMKDAVGSENVCVSSGQTTPTLSAARQGGISRASGERAPEPGQAINLRQDLLTPQQPHLLQPPPGRGTGAGIWGSLVILHHPPAVACLRRNVLRLARRVRVTPRSAGAVPLYTSENH